MVKTLIRSRLFGFLVAVTGAMLLVAGGFRWVRPVPGPPVGASLDEFDKIVTLSTSAGAPTASSSAIGVHYGVMHRVVVEGALDFETTNETLDADLLVAGDVPGMPRLVLGNGSAALAGVASAGRYVFELPDGIKDGGRLEVRLDTDPTVEKFLMTPQQVHEALRGEVSIELWTRVAPARGPIAAAPLWFPGGFLLALGIALSVMSGRIRRMERSPALALLDQIERRIAALRKATDASDLGAASLLAGLDRAGKEARSLAESIDKRTVLLVQIGPETEQAAPLRGAIGDAGRALQAIDAAIAEAHAHARSREIAQAAQDVEDTIASGLEARGKLARQVEALREADEEMLALEGRASTQTSRD